MKFWLQTRLLILVTTFCATFIPNVVQAIGVGNAIVHTEIFQPLKAEIELLDVGKLSADKIAVKLASHDDFKRVGIDFQYSLVDLRFAVVFEKSGKKYISVTSNKPIRESYLHFLIEVNELDNNSYKPVKSFLREYTLLLNAPLQRPEPVISANSGPVKPIKDVSFNQTTATAKPSMQKGGKGTITGSKYTTVSGDTLHEIAKRMGAGKNINQVMIAILDLNPKAFIGNNVNLVKAGFVLQLPDQQKIDQVNRAEALAIVREHNKNWRDGSATVAKQLDATKRNVAGTVQTKIEQDNVKVVAGGSSAQQEQLKSIQDENQELKSRLDSLQSQVEQLNKLIELKDQQLSELQKSLEQGNSKQPASSNSNQIDTEQVPPTTNLPPVEQPNNQITETKRPPTPPEPSPPEEVGIVDQILDVVFGLLENTLFLATLGGLFVLGILAFLGKKFMSGIGRKKATKSDDDISESELAILEQARASISSNSAISEAESFINYGQYGEAKDVLLAAINESPSNIDLRFKLLEVLGELGEASEFDLHKKQIIAIGGVDAANKVITLENAYPNLSDIGKQESNDVEQQPVIAEEEDVFKNLEGFEPETSLDEFEDFAELSADVSEDISSELNEMDGFTDELSLDESLELKEPEDSNALDIGLDFDVEDEAKQELDSEQEIELNSDVDSEELFANTDADNYQDEVSLDSLSDISLDLDETTLSEEMPQEISNDFDLDLVNNELEVEEKNILDEDVSFSDDLSDTKTDGLSFEDGSDDFSFLDSADEITTKFELAQAYIEMGDSYGAKEILEEIIKEGDDSQQSRAKEMIEGLA